MMNRRVYLDHNATSELRPQVRYEMQNAMNLTGNASSIHAEGRALHGFIEKSRDKIANLVRANPQNIIFTSGGTEANMTVLSPKLVVANRFNLTKTPKCFVSAIEHVCVLSGGHFAAGDVTHIPATSNGVIDLSALSALLEEHCHFLPETEPQVPFIVSVMLANNETGAIQPISKIAEIVGQYGGLLHTDAVQAAGKIPIDCRTLGADFITLSAHKFGGPQGVGALVLCSDNLVIGDPLLRGGGQELKRRAGTENAIGIGGFGAAAEEAYKQIAVSGRIRDMRDRLERRIRMIAPEAVIFAEEVERLPNTTYFSVAGLTAELLLIALDLEGIAVSSGAACSSGKVEPSHVLAAMGVPSDLANGAIRISLGWSTTDEDIEHFIAVWSKIYEKFKQRRAAA